jgi:hypothetical protein
MEYILNINISNHFILMESNLIEYPKIKKSKYTHLIVES